MPRQIPETESMEHAYGVMEILGPAGFRKRDSLDDYDELDARTEGGVEDADTVKQPEDWRSRFHRYFPLITVPFQTLVTILLWDSGGWKIAMIGVFAIVFALVIQAEYELRVRGVIGR